MAEGFARAGKTAYIGGLVLVGPLWGRPFASARFQSPHEPESSGTMNPDITGRGESRGSGQVAHMRYWEIGDLTSELTSQR